MFKLQNPEVLAQEALKYLDIAQKLEVENDIENAISHYQKAADFLKQSGYLMHRIQEIYDRIGELKDFLQKETLYQQTLTKAQIEQLQDQAFTLLEGAKKLEFDGFIEDAIQQYLAAIQLLVQAGWSEIQLENIKTKINMLSRDLEQKKIIQQPQLQETELKQKETQFLPDDTPQVVGMFGQKSSVEKAEVIEQFRAKKKHEEDIQNQAFEHIDAAKIFERDKKFDNAILNYERAIELLSSIGWSAQIQNIKSIIEKLKKDKTQFETLQAQQSTLPLTSDIEEQKVVLEREAELKKEKLMKFESEKKHEEQIQYKAFNLIDIGNRLERERKYSEAIVKFDQAIQLLRSIEWDTYVQPIVSLVNQIKDKQKREKVAEHLREKRQRDLMILRDSIYKKREEQIVKTAKELDKKRKEYEEKIIHEVIREEDLFIMLDKADNILKEKKFDVAINEYKNALSILTDLGPRWETYISMIKNTISNVEKLKHSQLTKKFEEQKKIEEREREELEFQKYVVIQLDKERNRLKKKEIIIKDRVEEVKFFEHRKHIAFEFLDSAIDSLKQGEYENSILAYQNAANIFAEIQWTEEIPLIEDSIREIEELLRNQNILKQKKLKDAIETQKKEEEFQKQISKFLQQERDNLKKKKIELMEREKEKKYREERRIAGFKLLEEAQDKVQQGNYDEAIEILKYAINFFADIEWQNEINLIQNAIVEIENKKREADLQNQIKMQTGLDREKQERVFQDYIITEMKVQKKKLKEKEITLREREKELAFREKKKQEAFDLLDKAQEFLSHRKFDDALEIYYNVINIFAQIQWTEEITIIQEAINNIENRKRENELNKQKLLQKSIKREAYDNTFIERIKYQRERRKAEILKEKEQVEKRKQLSAQNLAKQQKAFSIIEDGDNLLQIENLDEAISNYDKGIEILKDIGWGEGYLKLLRETIQSIEEKKRENEKEKQVEFEISLKQQQEDDIFQKRISEYMIKEQAKLKVKEIKIQQKEDLLQKMGNLKVEAFKIMDSAELLLDKGEYEESMKSYYRAELLLNGINFPTGAIREMIQKIQEKKREENMNKMKELELNLRRQQNEHIFQQQILEKIKFEEQKMKEKQENLLKQEDLRRVREQKKQEAFTILEEAQRQIEKGKFEETIDLYNTAKEIFIEIQWEEQIDLIEKAIIAIEDKKREIELQKQKELKAYLEQEKQDIIFQKNLVKEIKLQRDELKKRAISLREREEEIAYRERKKEEAFNILEKAQNPLSQGNFDDTIELYHNVANIFAQIQWTDEIPIINKAIQNIENKKKEKDLLKQKMIQDAIEKEKSDYEFMEKIKVLKDKEETKALEERELIHKRELITSQNLEQQEEAFKLISDGYNLLSQKKYDNALKNYQNAINFFTEIGWTSDYLKLLQDTIITIEIRKRDIERQKEIENELLIQQQKEEEKFHNKISESMRREQERLKAKEIEIQKREKLKQLMENRKQEAFKVMDLAENLFNQKKFVQAIEKYRQAELLLNEIGFPTNVIREMIYKIQEKTKEEWSTKQINLENILQKERENFKFQQKLAESIKINELKLKERQIGLQKQREIQEYMENRRDEAFNLLEEAETFMNKTQYGKSLEYYHAAELILNEIAYPTETIRELILKVQEKKREHQIQKQKELEQRLLRERDDWKFQQKISKNLLIEKERLKAKELELLKKEQLKQRLEERKEQAFKILEEGERYLKEQNYDNALVCYRRASIFLNELQFPTDSINNMIFKINILKKQTDEAKLLKYKKELESLEEGKTLKALVEERKRQERDKRDAQQLAQKEREKIIQEQMSVRESAYSLLEEAGKYLKHRIPNYNEAISLYIQARHILAENIGWEPEINNLNTLIKDLQQEQANFLEKKRLEEQARLQRQNEYALFQEEVKRRRIEQEKLKQEQEKQYQDLIYKKQHVEQIKDEGLKLIDKGKKQAAYHNFDEAYTNFESAIIKFREIGWNEEIKYIATEIKNTKLLEEKVKNEEERIQLIQEQLEKQRITEEKRKKVEEAKLKESISEVSGLADEVIDLIEKRRQKQKLAAKKQEKIIKYEAKEFRKEMGNLIKMKQELIDEIATKEEEKREFEEKLKKAKEREEIDNLKRMIKESSEKKKS